MSIMWKYLDKRTATIAALKDFKSMQFIIKNSGEEIKGAYETMAGVTSPTMMSGIRKPRNWLNT